jgi:hypothetical protein
MYQGLYLSVSSLIKHTVTAVISLIYEKVNSVKVCITADLSVTEIRKFGRVTKNWLHVERTEHSRIPRVAMEYKAKGKRDTGCPKTRWKDQQVLQN